MRDLYWIILMWQNHKHISRFISSDPKKTALLSKTLKGLCLCVYVCLWGGVVASWSGEIKNYDPGKASFESHHTFDCLSDFKTCSSLKYYEAGFYYSWKGDSGLILQVDTCQVNDLCFDRCNFLAGWGRPCIYLPDPSQNPAVQMRWSHSNGISFFFSSNAVFISKDGF